MNLVCCQGCRAYKKREVMRHVGLGYVCDAECLERVRQRARDRQAGRKTAASRRRERRSKQGTSYKGPPAGVRKQVRVRDGQCRWCGTHWRLTVHHIVYRSQGGSHAPSNLITLCESCHGRAHSDKNRWQSVLSETVRLTAQGQFLMVPEVEKRLGALP